jgi:hypothetical protein
LYTVIPIITGAAGDFKCGGSQITIRAWDETTGLVGAQIGAGGNCTWAQLAIAGGSAMNWKNNAMIAINV